MKSSKIWWLIGAIALLASAMSILALQFVIPWINKETIQWGIQELVAAFTVLAIFTSVFAPILHKHLNKQTVYLIDINVKPLEDNYVRFSASIQNVGDVQIKTLISNLYIDQGTLSDLPNDYYNTGQSGVHYYKFPFILEHRQKVKGRPDCILCTKCFRNNDEAYPENYIDQDMKAQNKLVRTHYKLEHLSKKSIMYINPKEKFSEDVVVHFSNPGVYRVTLFVGAADTADCSCATKQFVIPEAAKREPLK